MMLTITFPCYDSVVGGQVEIKLKRANRCSVHIGQPPPTPLNRVAEIGDFYHWHLM